MIIILQFPYFVNGKATLGNGGLGGSSGSLHKFKHKIKKPTKCDAKALF